MIRKALFLSAALLIFATNSFADLTGDTVHIAQNYPVLGSEFFPVNPVVGPGLEFNEGFVYTVNVGPSSIDVTFVSDGGFVDVPSPYPPNWNGPVVSGLNDSSGNPLTGFSNFSTTLPGFDASLIQFDATSIRFLFQNLSFATGQNVHVDLNFGPGTVPEASSLAVWSIMGLVGIAAGLVLQKKSVKLAA